MKKIIPVDLMMGQEPTWTKQDPEQEKLALGKAFNWYGYNCTRKEAKEFVIDYLKKLGRNKEEINRVKALPDSAIPLQFGWLSRMISMGFVPSDKTKNYFATTYKSILAETQKKKLVVQEEETPVQTISIQQRITEKASSEAGEVEGLVDEFILSGCKKDIDFANYFKSRNLSSVVLKRICEVFVNRSKQIEIALTTNDSQIKEGYSNFSKVQLRKYKEFLDSIVVAANAGAETNKPVRKKRKVKEKPATVLISKMNYMEAFPELGLVSITPEKVIGALQLWVYNTKTKTLGVYHADNAKGLSVKGSTLQNFNEQSSIGKRLRKPEVTIKEVMEAGKVKLKRILPDLSTKESLLTGRMNSDTIILRVS